MDNKNVIVLIYAIMDDTSTVLSVSVPKSDAKATHARSTSQNEQLARARAVALNNRRIKLKSKLEERLSELRSVMDGMSNDQIERMVGRLIETEDRHRTKLATVVDRHAQQMSQLYDEVKTLKTMLSQSAVKKITLSDVSSRSR